MQALYFISGIQQKFKKTTTKNKIQDGCFFPLDFGIFGNVMTFYVKSKSNQNIVVGR